MCDFQQLAILDDPGSRSECSFIDAIANVVSSVFGDDPNEARRGEATTAFNRQRQLFGERYQLQMKDMRKAGLNPILAYRQSPPGTGGVAMAPVENMSLSRSQTALASASAYKASQEAATQRDVRAQLRAATAREEATARNIAQDTRLKQVEEMLRGTRLTQEAIRNRILAHEEHVARSRGTSARATEQLYREAPMLRQLDELLRILFGRGGPTRD